ncbi:DUF192 domain-containing protein [Sphingomicrobium sp. XHP0239]|uniref:DUF192 domain-containing protein n=1 Tax=Sphingomicrobium maritimum TaxID=3133972 RepID=UPI0031CCCC5E
MRTALAALLAAMVATPLAACQPAAEEVVTAPSGLAEREIAVTTSDGQTHPFTVEVAETREQQNRGLMFRETLAPDRGMIFLYDDEAVRGFWMRNTYIPLDIIYIRADGTIATIHANTLPLSEAPYSSLEPVQNVLEIAGGRAAELGISEGDKVQL